MKLRLALAGLAVVMLASLGGVATAGAAPNAEPTVDIVGKVKINKDGSGTVKAHYICPPGDDWHLWVSAKQAADGSQEEAITGDSSGFGGIADIWLQSHPTTYQCDGKWHTQKFRIDTSEPLDPEHPEAGTIGRGELTKGWAWVQFCLIKGGSETEEPELFLYDFGWKKVR